MATINVSPGLNTIQAGINAANNTSGDEVVLAAGTYTFNTSQAMNFISAVTGTLFTNLTVRAATGATVILNFTGVGFDAIYGGDATGVTIKDITITGTPTSGGVIRDHADSLYTGWTFQNITLDAMTKTPWLIVSNPASVGTSLTIKGIVTTANFAAPRVIDITGVATDLNLLIQDIDVRLHSGALLDAIRLIDVRDVRIDGVQVYAPDNHGVYVQSVDAAKGVYDVDMFNIEVDGNGGNNAPLIYAGHNSLLKVSKRVRLHGAITRNSGSYGIEFEGGVEDSEIVNCRVYNSVDNGIPIPDSTKNILVADCVVDGVTGNLNTGIHVAYGRRHRVLRNVISNCYRALRCTEDSQIAMENERNIFRDNVIYNCAFAYRVTAAAMPSGVLSNRLGPNTIFTPTTAFADTDSGNMTQAQFEAAFAGSIERSDTVISESSPSLMKYSTQQALNILAGNMDAPYVKYSSQQAANMLVGNTAGNMNKFSLQQALNIAASS